MSLFSKKYALDYCFQKETYKRAKDAYRAGANVKLYYHTIGTDTDYSFFLNGKRLLPLYDKRCGYIIKFRMPDRDSKLQCISSNSMFNTEDDGQNEI